MSRARRTGFTLYELLIAVALLGLLASFAYTGLAQLAFASEQRARALEDLAAVQRTVALLSRDITYAAARPVREGFHGSAEPALSGGVGATDGLTLTRAGWLNPNGAPRPPLQRVSYTLESGRLVRRAWRVLDRAPDSEPAVRAILDHVRSFEVQFLDADGWQDAWPAAGRPADDASLPSAVRCVLVVEGIGRIERVVEIGGPAG